MKKNKKAIFLKSFIITLIVFFTVLIGRNLFMKYKEYISNTKFTFKYETLKIGEYKSDSKYYKELISTPTVENDVEKLLNDFNISLDGYHVIYLVITQYGDIPNDNLNISFIKYGNYNKDNMIKEISKDGEKNSQKISISISKNKSIKVPVGICKITDEQSLFTDCIYVRYKPEEISYDNKYPFSKKIEKMDSISLYIEKD